MPTYRTAHDETLDAMLAAVRGATVAGIIGADPVAWASTTSPRVHAGNRAGYVAGLHRGRLPAVEIYSEREEWTRVADSGGDLVSVWVVRAHVPGPTLDAADRLARLLLHASFTAIRSAQLGGGSYLEHGAVESVGELAASPYGFALEARITVAHSYGRDTHEVHEVPDPPVLFTVTPNPTDTSSDPTFTIHGSGFLSFVGQLFAVAPSSFIGPFTEGVVVIDDNTMEIAPGIVPLLASQNPAPFTFAFWFLPDVGDPFPTEDVAVAGTGGPITITGVTPTTFPDGGPVGDFYTDGSGFLSPGLVMVELVAPGGAVTVPCPFLVLSDIQFGTSAFDMLAAVANLASLAGLVAPFDYTIRATPIGGATPAESGPITVTPAIPPPLDPLGDAYYVGYFGGPGQIPVTVNQGGGYVLAALEPPITHGTPTVPAFGNDDYSLAVWFRRRDFAGGLLGFAQYILSGIASAAFYTGSLEAVIASAGGDVADAPPGTYPDNDMDWHMAAMVRDYTAGFLRLYIDGALVVSVPVTAPATMEDQGSFTFGTAGGPGIPPCQATGAAWTRALTDAEVQTMFAATIFPP